MATKSSRKSGGSRGKTSMTKSALRGAHTVGEAIKDTTEKAWEGLKEGAESLKKAVKASRRGRR